MASFFPGPRLDTVISWESGLLEWPAGGVESQHRAVQKRWESIAVQLLLKKTILPSSPLSQGQEQGKMDAPAHKQRSTDHFSYYIFVTFRISIDWMGPSHWSRWIFLKWSINSNAISSRKCFTEVLFHYLPGHPLTQGSCHMKLVIVEREKNSLSTYFLNVKMKMFLIKLQEKAFPSKASWGRGWWRSPEISEFPNSSDCTMQTWPTGTAQSTQGPSSLSILVFTLVE